MRLDNIAMATESRRPEGCRLEEGSGSYTGNFHDTNGVRFEILAEPMTVREYREKASAPEEKENVPSRSRFEPVKGPDTT